MPSLAERILQTIWPELAGLRAEVNALQAQMGAVMATQEQFNDRMAQLDAATNEIASDLQALRDQLKNQGIPDSALATLDAKIARLQELGKDPENPVP